MTHKKFICPIKYEVKLLSKIERENLRKNLVLQEEGYIEEARHLIYNKERNHNLKMATKINKILDYIDNLYWEEED
jgi:hypothetical protein